MTSILDYVGIVLWYGSIPISIYVSAISYFRTTGSVARKLGAALCFLISILILTAFSGLALAFRDGLGPDAQPSVGMEALLRSIPEIGIAAVAGGVFAAIGWIIKTVRAPGVEAN